MESNISAPQAIGKRIALLRQQKGLTQTELGNMIHQRREIVSYWENGSRDIKSGDIILLADALDTTCDYILRGIQSENIDIYKATGLCDEAIKFFQYAFPPDRDQLNTLLTCRYAEMFFSTMREVAETAAELNRADAAFQSLVIDHTVKIIESCTENTPLPNPIDERAHEFFDQRNARDRHDLALFRWTKIIMEIAKEIKEKAIERGDTDEES